MTSADFLSSLGVDTHIPYTDGGYANLANVASDLRYLGITNIRDTISDGTNGSAPLSSYIALAQAGMSFTFFVPGGAVTTASLQATLALIAAVNAAVPGSVVAVEGPNEINNFALSYNGVGGLQGALNLQQDLYAFTHANPALQGVAVDYFSGYGAGSIGTGPNPATVSGLADYDTQHPYPNFGTAPAAWVNPAQALGNETSSQGPAVYTETGYSSNGGTNGAVDPTVQAKYTLDLLMDDAKFGISRTYLYQLMDAYAPGSPQGDDGFGLFDPSNAPKPVATAIHDLTSILADPGAGAASFTPASFNYSVSGLPATGNSLLVQKSDGTNDIVVWNEPQIWDESTGSEIAAASSTVTVSLGATYSTVEVFDPLSSAGPIETLSDVNSVSIGVSDHPVIIEVSPQLALNAISHEKGITVMESTASIQLGTPDVSSSLSIAPDGFGSSGNAPYAGSVVAKSGQAITFSSLFSIPTGSGSPQYLIVSGLDRNEYTAASNGNTGTLSGNGSTAHFSSLGGDSYGVGIVFTYNSATSQYLNSTFGNLANLVLTASTDTNRNELISLFSASSSSSLTTYANNPYDLAQFTTLVGSVDVVTQPGFAGTAPIQATPNSICGTALTFVGQAWNDNGCWTLACNIAAEAGASLPLTSTSLGIPGVASGEWIVAYNGPAGQSGNWQSMIKAGEMVVFETSSTSGHITTVVSGSGSSAQLVDNITYVNGSGTIVNSANDGSANDVIVAAPHAASQEFSQAVAGSVVIYELDTPTIGVSVANSTVVAGAQLSLSGLFSASDPASKSITEYQLYDTGSGGAATDSFLVNGVLEAAHTAASAITIAASALANSFLQAAAASGQDTLEVRAYNGTYWGDWQSLSASVSGTSAPAVVTELTTDVARAYVVATSSTSKSEFAAKGNVLSNDIGTGLSVTGIASSAATGVIGTALAGAHGTLTINANGIYTYTINPNDAVALAASSTQPVTDTFAYTVSNINGVKTSSTLTIDITGFNALDYIASYGDLIKAFGTNAQAGTSHYISNGNLEGRVVTFNGLDYIASYSDLIKAFGANEQAGATHFITNGYNEGRKTTFNGLDYIASYGDLIKAFGANEQAGATHFITNGYNEGRKATFNGLDYIASYADLIKAFGANEQAGATHFITNGYNEGRTITFNGLAYIATYGDLISAFGASEQAGAAHYITNGYNEGRVTLFNAQGYLSNNTDLQAQFGTSVTASNIVSIEDQYIQVGYSQGRTYTDTNISVSDLSAALADTHLSSFTILDNAATVSANLDTLETLVSSGKITGIALSDSGAPVLAITSQQQANDVAVLRDIGSSYTLSVVPNGASAFVSASAALATDYVGSSTSAAMALTQSNQTSTLASAVTN